MIRKTARRGHMALLFLGKGAYWDLKGNNGLISRLSGPSFTPEIDRPGAHGMEKGSRYDARAHKDGPHRRNNVWHRDC